MELQPDDVDTLNYLGILALACHQFREALALGEQARLKVPRPSHPKKTKPP